MSKFEDLVPPGTDAIWRELRALRQEVAELRSARSTEATSVSAGMFTVDKDGGFRVLDRDNGNLCFYAGLGYDKTTGESIDQTTVFWERNDGSRWLGVDWWPTTGEQVGTWRDRDHHALIQDDRLGEGFDRPWLPIYGTHQFEGVATEGTVFQYRSLPVTAITTEQTLWEARIPLVSHPRLDMFGTWGSSTGSSNVTYRLEVGTDTVGTWSTTGTELRSDRGSGGTGVEGGFDMSAWLWFVDVRVRLLVTATGTGNAACEVLSAYMRGTPPP